MLRRCSLDFQKFPSLDTPRVTVDCPQIQKMFNHDMGHGKVPLLQLWKRVYLGNRSKTTSIKLQETYGGNLVNFLEVCRKNNLTLNAEKMQFRLPKVFFFGHTWSDHGLSPDPKENRGSEENGIPSRCGNNETFTRLGKLSQSVQPSFSRVK